MRSPLCPAHHSTKNQSKRSDTTRPVLPYEMTHKIVPGSITGADKLVGRMTGRTPLTTSSVGARESCREPRRIARGLQHICLGSSACDVVGELVEVVTAYKMQDTSSRRLEPSMLSYKGRLVASAPPIGQSCVLPSG